MRGNSGLAGARAHFSDFWCSFASWFAFDGLKVQECSRFSFEMASLIYYTVSNAIVKEKWEVNLYDDCAGLALNEILTESQP